MGASSFKNGGDAEVPWEYHRTDTREVGKMKLRLALGLGSSVAAALAVTAIPVGAGAGTLAAARPANGIVHAPVVITSSNGETQTSENWAGFGAEGKDFTKVIGSWVQPASLNCSSTHDFSSFWVGIDGFSAADPTVEQLGTDSDCAGGAPRYYGWTEMYPKPSVNLPAGHLVKAGDALSAEVSRKGNSYTLSETDATQGWTYSITESGPVKGGVDQDKNLSVEWIAESPEVSNGPCDGFAHLTDFGTMKWTGAEAAEGGVLAPISSLTSSGGPFLLKLVDKCDGDYATPSALSSSGEAFSITWKAS
jgi:hypothetical protein